LSLQYNIQKRVLNSDFTLSRTKNANKLEIKEDQGGAILKIKQGEDTILYEIPLKNVIETDIICLKKYRKTDKLIQIIFIEGKQHLRIMRLNVQDNQIDSLNDKICEISSRATWNDDVNRTCADCD
jgi:hypothetical protein